MVAISPEVEDTEKFQFQHSPIVNQRATALKSPNTARSRGLSAGSRQAGGEETAQIPGQERSSWYTL